MDQAMTKAPRFDAADYLDGPEAIAAYLSEATETRDDDYIAQAIATAARACEAHLRRSGEAFSFPSPLEGEGGEPER